MAEMLRLTYSKTRPRLAVLALAAHCLAASPIAEAASQRYALLIGIGNYADTDSPKLELKGPPNDVQAMQTALKAWGFNQITVLQNAQATRAAIFKALDEVIKKAEPGSHVLFYFSGHGTSTIDPNLGTSLALTHTTGALVPYDANRKGTADAKRKSLIIGHDDLRPRFEQLDKKGVYLTAWVDACYSENSTRSVGGPTPRKAPGFAFDSGDFGTGSAGKQPYPYQNAFTFAASAANQTATDIDDRRIRQFPTFDQQHHGAFSDALLRALNDRRLPGYGPLDKNGDGVVSVDEFTNGVTSFMGSRAYEHQPKPQPLDGEDRGGVRNQPLFVVNQPSQSPAPVAAKPEPAAPPIPANLPEPQRRQQLLDRLAGTAQQAGRATVTLELQHPYASSRLPIGDATHCVKVDLSFKADQKGYPLVIDRFSDGGVQWLYPLAGADDRRRQNQWQQPVPAGQAQKLSSSKTTPPPGVDTLYTFLLDQPLAAEVITSTDTIKPADGARFDLLLGALEKVQILGAHRLALEVYEPQPNELKNWPQEVCP